MHRISHSMNECRFCACAILSLRFPKTAVVVGEMNSVNWSYCYNESGKFCAALPTGVEAVMFRFFLVQMLSVPTPL
jgi:hypothetical protein